MRSAIVVRAYLYIPNIIQVTNSVFTLYEIAIVNTLGQLLKRAIVVVQCRVVENSVIGRCAAAKSRPGCCKYWWREEL